MIKPQWVIETLFKVTNGDAYITSDVGQHQMFAAQYYRFNKPRRWINSGGLGTMGFGFPAAMGVKLAFPDADVACVTGEGSIQMNIQELSTCTQYRVPVKIINLNNGYLGMVKQWQHMQYEGRYSYSTYMKIRCADFVKLAEAYGHVGIRVDKKEDLEDAMREAFALKDRLVFMDIHVDPHEHVYPMLVAAQRFHARYVAEQKRSGLEMRRIISLLRRKRTGCVIACGRPVFAARLQYRIVERGGDRRSDLVAFDADHAGRRSHHRADHQASAE